jgi:hypothetical protein
MSLQGFLRRFFIERRSAVVLLPVVVVSMFVPPDTAENLCWDCVGTADTEFTVRYRADASANIAPSAAATGAMFAQTDTVRLPERASCIACRLKIEIMATLGTDSVDGYLTDYPLWASMDHRGVIYVALQPPGGLLLTFDTTGRFLGRIGRKGRGPGEFQFPVSAVPASRGELLVWDFIGSFLTVLDSSRRYASRVHQPYSPVAVLADGSRLVIAPMMDRDRRWYPLHIYDERGRRVKSFGAVTGEFSETERWRLIRSASVGRRGTIWSAFVDSYVIEEWSDEGQKLRTFVRSVPWMPAVVARSDGAFGQVPNARIVALVEDESERLWVFSRVPSSEWRTALGPPRVAGGRTSFPQRDQGRLLDSMVDVIDLRSNRLLFTTRVNGNIRFVLSSEPTLAQYREDDDGTPLLDVLRISLQTATTRR